MKDVISPSPTLRVYFAGRFSRRAELLGYKQELEADAPGYGVSIEVTSRWLLGGHEWSGVEDEAIPLAEAQRFAREDLEDLHRAQVLVCFTEPPRTGPARGGRHVEFGFALARDKRTLCVGHRENVFYALPQIDFAPNWSEAETWLLGVATERPALVRSIRSLAAELAALRTMEAMR